MSLLMGTGYIRASGLTAAEEFKRALDRYEKNGSLPALIRQMAAKKGII